MALTLQYYSDGDYSNTILRKILQNQVYAIINGGGGGGGAVDSVFGRTGAVVADATDYSTFYGQLGTANSWLGVNTYASSFIFTPDPVTVAANAGAINIDKVHSTVAISANVTLTPSGAGTIGQQIAVIVTNSDTASHSVTGAGTASSILFTAAANSTTTTYWRSTGAAWLLVGGAVTINDLSTVTPVSTDTLSFWDASAGVTAKATLNALVAASGITFANISAGILAGNITLGESSGQIVLDPTLSADGTWSGIMEAGTAGATLAFGDLVYFQASDSRWELVDADAEATSGPLMLGMCVLAAASDGSATNILRWGKIRADANFPTLTIGAPAYASTTPGDIQVAQPSGADDVIRIIGHACTADVLLFNPASDYMVHV